MIECFMGIKDYYKILSHDDKKLTCTLNQPSKRFISAIKVPKISLPTELIILKFKSNSKNMIEMYLKKIKRLCPNYFIAKI